MSDVIEVSYTGDLLAHRRCPRAWCYEKHAGFVPYEQVQAMEGRLLHHAMEWMSRCYADRGELVTRDELREQLERFYRVLRSRGITTAFTTRDEVLSRISDNLFRGESLRRPVEAAVRGAEHTEYELKSVRKVLKTDFAGKNRILLTGIIDLVLQQQDPLEYRQIWRWDDLDQLTGEPTAGREQAAPGDREIWDIKGSRIKTQYLTDYVRQVVTYAALYRERTGTLPRRCVLFFVNERQDARALLSVPIDEAVVESGLAWTVDQVADLRRTLTCFEQDPDSVDAGTVLRRNRPVGDRVDEVLRAQCTGCAQRFDCVEYTSHLDSKPGDVKRDVSPYAVGKN
ncbi:MAG: PD-(D/E)XK nuclease family protein [Actinomycetota bacterium]|nr:PD-(D/E)XK nuclease family protein [Actinomycetota bacterium]